MTDATTTLIESPRFGRSDLIFFAAVFLYLYTHIFELPFTPIYFEGDHMINLSNAMRMSSGERIYLDFFHFIPPGAELIYLSAFSIFDVRPWVLNLVVFGLGLAQAGLLWHLSRQVVSGYAAYLPAAIYFVIGYRLFGIDGTYRLFSVVFVLAAVAVLFKSLSTRTIACAGVFCGMASFFVHTRGLVAVVGIACFLLWHALRQKFAKGELIRQVVVLGIAFAATITVTNLYFLWQTGAEIYYFSMVEFVRSHYIHDPLAKTTAYFADFPDASAFFSTHTGFAGLSRYIRYVHAVLFYYALVPFVYLIYLAVRRYAPQLRELAVDKRVMLLVFVGIAMAVGTSAPTALRLYHVAIPAVIVLVYLLCRVDFAKRAIPAVLIMFALLAGVYSIQRQMIEKYYVTLPGGIAAFQTEVLADKYRWVAERTDPGDALFEAHHPSFYFPLQLRNPTPLYLMRDSQYTPAFQVNAVLEALQADPPKIIVWNGFWSKAPEQRAEGDNLAPLWAFIQQNYSRQAEFVDHGEFTLESTRRVEMWTLNE